jgi:hypothetical protein
MNLSPTSIFLCLSLLLVAPFGPGVAHATLGEKADSIAKDRKALSAVKKATTSHENYTVQEVASDATTVREYINPEGIIFAVAWDGMAHPDLTALLGSYASDYHSAKQKQPRRHGQKRSQVTGDKVVVETGGHMRNLRGRAYLPTLIPEGVALNEIK